MGHFVCADAACRAGAETSWPHLEPVHPVSAELHGPLRQLRFLLGHFAGEGRFGAGDAAGERTFYKEMLGMLEAGGRFLSVRMAVGYPVADGRIDTHQALVIISSDEDAALHARAYTDGGRQSDFSLALQGRGICFADVVAAHGEPTRPARKLLQPAPEGLLEHVELDLGERGFAAYSSLTLRRAHGV